jgi:hypothetical protein
MAYTPKSTIFGLPSGQVEWNADFTATRDDKGKWTGSESFTCRLSNATALIPSNGTPCQLPGWSFMLVSSVHVANLEGDLVQVTCTYGGFQEDAGADEENPSSATYELGIVTNEEPIESHFRYKDVPDEDLAIIQNVKSGKYEEISDTPFSYQNIANKDDTSTYTIESDRGQELVTFLTTGVETYLYPAQIWRTTFTSKKLPTATILNKVGKITTAKGAPAVSDDRNWLFLGCNVTEQDKVYTVSHEWQLSGKGGWDEDLYS